MSALGHSRPMHSVPVPIKVRCYSNSDIIVRRSEVTLRAKRKLMHRSISALFDHLVGGGEQGLRERQAKRLGRLEVEDKLEFGRLLNR